MYKPNKNLAAQVMIYSALLLIIIATANWPTSSLNPALVYPLDDTYIHLSIGRTLAAHDVWGITPEFPASASSSPLYTLIIAAVYTLCPGLDNTHATYLPLAINYFFGLALISVFFLLTRPLSNRSTALFITWFSIALAPLSFIGMEHVIHVLLATVLFWLGTREIAYNTGHLASLITIGAVASLAIMARYESLFLVLSLGVAAFLMRRWGLTITLSIAAGIPLVGFGCYWISHDGFFFPNSILLKGSAGTSPDILQKLTGAAGNLLFNIKQFAGRGLTLLILANALCFLSKAVRNNCWLTVACGVSIATSVLHLAFASVGWLYRYEAWIISLNLLVFFFLIETLTNETKYQRLAIIIIALAMLPRSFYALKDVIRAPTDRRWEHILPAEFVSQFFPDKVVFVNDIGYLAFSHSATVVDFFGLGHNTPVRLRQQANGYSADELLKFGIEQQASLAIVQLCWNEVNKRLPPQWHLVGLWKGPRNVVFGDKIVAFMAMTHEEVTPLRIALKTFTLPKNVQLQTDTSEIVREFNNTLNKTQAAEKICR